MDKVVFSIFGDIEIDAETDAAPDAEFHAPQQIHSGMTQKGGPGAPGGGKLACNIAPAESGVLCMYCKFTETSKIKIVGDDDEQDIIAGAIWRHNAARTSFTETTVTEMVQLR